MDIQTSNLVRDKEGYFLMIRVNASGKHTILNLCRSHNIASKYIKYHKIDRNGRQMHKSKIIMEDFNILLLVIIQRIDKIPAKI